MKLLRVALVGVVVLALTGCAPNREQALDECVDFNLGVLDEADPEMTRADPALTMSTIAKTCLELLEDDPDRFYRLYAD
jgi:hypothetical protein